MLKRMKNTKIFKFIPIILAVLLAAGAFSACSKKSESTQTTTTATTSAAEVLAAGSDVTVDENATATITLNGSSATVKGEGVKVDGATVLITAGGTFSISGTLDDGSVIVDADGQNVTLLLNGANITCSYSSAIYVYNAKSATVYVKEGTENTLSDGSTYTYKDSYSSAAEEEPNACLYAKDDLTVAGSGSLTVKGNFNNGIVSKDTLLIENVTLTVTAKNNGINGKDFLSVKKATLKVTAGGDALRSTNDTDTALGYIVIASSKLTLTAKEDGMQAQTYISIASSQMKISAGGGSSVSASDDVSSKGIKAGTDITVKGGTYVIDASDDAMHTNGNITVSDGTFTLTTADDGIHADNSLTIDGGTFTITGHEGLEATLITINDGDITIAASDDGMNAAQKVSGVTPCVEINGGKITINMGQGDTDAIDSNGNVIINGGTVNITGQSGFDYDGTGELNGGTVYVNGEKQTALTNQFAGGGMGDPGGMGGRP